MRFSEYIILRFAKNSFKTSSVAGKMSSYPIAELITSGTAAQLQQVGNERVDAIARRRAESNQPEIPLTLRTVYNQSLQLFTAPVIKPSKTQIKAKDVSGWGGIPLHLKRAEAVARFRLTIGYDKARPLSSRLLMRSDRYVGLPV
ncbi:hypothetical protein NPIL_11941 [Nephila pilipes]|uniref:Uncharacterized protein n=1 Tax=Nephila pilipes TaxID=299642 RepID=A0A8X6USB7_NEPPI|nr:hypothetical protein NPIL_11941 [Nephila pilipes]